MNQIEKICRQNPELVRQIALEILRLTDSADNVKTDETVNLSVESKPETKNPFNDSRVELSIILPVYNEEENIFELYHRLTETLDNQISGGIEILFVNDGSGDNSENVIAELRKKDSRVKLINFSRNFGHQAAITAGIDYSTGAVVIMDADLQDPPEVLIPMLEAWRDGAEVVYAVREKREEDDFLKKNLARSFYRVLQLIAHIDIPLDSGDFCLLDRKVVNQLKAMPEKNRFLRGLRSWVGFRQTAVTFKRPARFAGKAKYTFKQSFRLALNGIFAFSSFPLRLAAYVGFITCLAALSLLFYAFGAYFFDVRVQRGWTSLLVVVLLVSGIQLILLGSIGEYIARIYDEVKQRPNYIVREFLD
ncbi:glycosyltransferase family 2 protein [soil metagenome]